MYIFEEKRGESLIMEMYSGYKEKGNNVSFSNPNNLDNYIQDKSCLKFNK